MIQILIIILFLCILAVLYLSKPKWLEKRMPWIWEHIGAPIFRYYFVTTVRKITIIYFSTFGAIAAANPILKLCFKINWNTKNGDIWASLDWGNDWIDITCVILALLLTFAYCIYILYERKKLQIPSDEVLAGIKNIGESNGRKLQAALNRLSNTSITKSLIPQLQDSIKSLHIKTADSILEKLKVLVLQEKFVDFPLLMQLEYNIGRCMRYADEKKALAAFNNAYQAMEKAQLFDQDVAIAKIFCLCKNGEYDKTFAIIEQLKERNCNSIWTIIPTILSSENPFDTYDNQPVELKANQELLANLLLLDEGKHFNPEKLDFENFFLVELKELTLDNIPLWALHFSVLQTRFLNEWMIGPEGKNKKEVKVSKELYDETEKYLRLQAKTELGKIFPDIDFIHAWVAYIHDHSPLWIDKIKSYSYSPQNKELYFIAVASMLVSEHKMKEAVDFLGNSEKAVSLNILGYRLKFAFQLGQTETIKEIFSLVISANEHIEDNLLANLLSCIQYYNSDVFDFVPKLHFEDDVKKRCVVAVALFFAEKNVDMDYLNKHINEIPNILKPYIAMIFEKYVGVDSAINIIEPIVDYHYFDIRAFIYFNLLRKEQRYGTKLYDFCEKMRKNGSQTEETLLCELQMAEKLEDFGKALEITTMMMNNSKRIGVFVEHHLMALYKNKKKDDIAQFYPHLKEYVFDNVNSIKNIFNVYLLVDMYFEALDFLYSQVEVGISQELRDFYYQASMNKEIGNLVHKQYDVIETGSYVMVDIDGQKDYLEILLCSQYDILIGKRPGDSIDIELFNHSQHVEVLAIFNKYHKLYMEIMKEIHEHKSKSIRSFTIEDLESGDGILANLGKLSGTDEDYKKAWNEAVEKYKNGETTLYELVEESSLVANLYNKIFGDFIICSLPRNIIMAKLQNSKIDIASLQPVLDFSGLILMQELSVRFNLKFKNKFILPKSIETAIQNTLSAEKKGIPSFIEPKVLANLTIETSNGKLEESPFVSKLKSLLEWVTLNCSVESNKEILNHDSKNIVSVTHRMFLDSTMLTLNKNRVLISEDWVVSIMTYCPNNYCAMSVTNWLALTRTDSIQEIDDYIFGLKYLGCEITSDHIFKIPFLDATTKKQVLPVLVENIKRFKPVSAVKEAAIRLIDGRIFTPDITNFVLSIFIALFKDMDYVQAIRLKVQLQRSHGNEMYRQLLEDAYKITHPLIL